MKRVKAENDKETRAGDFKIALRMTNLMKMMMMLMW